MTTRTYPREEAGVRPSGARAAPVGPAGPHFWARGPLDVVPLNRAKTRWRFRWYLERVDGMSKREALRAIYAVLHDPRGWARSGVHFVRTMDQAQAHIRLAIIPSGTSVCGANAAGCYSSTPGALPLAEVDVTYLRDPLTARIVLGMELCGHGCFRALDGYTAPHQPYGDGVLGTWAEARAVAGYPSDWEIAGVQQWLRGETPAAAIHDD